MTRATMALALTLTAALSQVGRAGEGAAPATQPPAITVGEERLLLVDGPGKGVRATPNVAFGKDVYLAAWREGWHGKGGGARIYGTRLSVEGKVLDPKGIEIAPNKTPDAPQERPRIAFCRDIFLVVWQDFRNGKDYDVLGVRVTPDGKVLDAEPIKIAIGAGTQAIADVASDGQGFLVVWQAVPEKGEGYLGYAATVSVEGQVGAAVETGVAPQPKAAWGGANYLVVGGGAGFWAGHVRAAFLGADGKPSGKPFETITGTKEAVFSISGANGKGWTVLSHRSPPDPWGWGGPGAMRCAVVTPDGKVEKGPPDSYPQSKLPNWLDFGSVKDRNVWPLGENASAWDGRQFVAVWQRFHITGEKKSDLTNCEIMACRLDGYKPVEQDPVPVAATLAEERYPSLASNGAGKLLCVYQKKTDDGDTQICARVIETR